MDFRTVKWRKIGLLTLHTFASPNFALHNMRAYYVYYKCGDVSMEMLKIWYEWMEPRFRVLNSERQPFCTTYIGEDWANQIAHCHIYFSLWLYTDKMRRIDAVTFSYIIGLNKMIIVDANTQYFNASHKQS